MHNYGYVTTTHSHPAKTNGAETPSERVSKPMQTDTQNAHKYDATSSTNRITPSHAYTLLSCARRRYALRVIVRRGEVTKSELIDAVGEREYGKPARQINSTERKRIHVSLHQHHLPTLEASNVIEMDRYIITPGPNASDVLEYDHDTRSGILSGVVKSVRR